MKNKFKVLLFIFLFSTSFETLVSQAKYEINFVNTKSFTRDKLQAYTYPVYLQAKIGNLKDSDNYKAVVSVDETSELPKAFYKIDFTEKNFEVLNEKDSSKNTIYITIYKDSIEDRTWPLVLKVDVYRNNVKLNDSLNTGKFKTLKIDVEGIKEDDSLKAYNYLAYIGTNFDLVDGVKTKNLFFSTNIFLPPLKKKSVGMYLSLYGNRTMTTTDTSGNVIRTSKLVGISDTTYKRFTEQTTLLRTQVSDNLGAYVSPLIRLGNASNRENTIQLYYTPSLEFIWRRTNIYSNFTGSTNVDSVIERGSFHGTIEYGRSSSINVNEFVFSVGLISLMVVHESKEISVRIHGSTGIISTYSPLVAGLTKGDLNGSSINQTNYTTKHDMFFTGRAWITESVTGITLQAEITNTLKYPRPFYGVTLSKAINFKNLGKIFQPIVTR